MRKITSNVYIESSFGGGRPNKIFVTTSEGIVVIDSPMFTTDAVNWSREISKYGQVRYLIITDQHADHFQGNHFFSGTIVAHEATREAIKARPLNEAIAFAKRVEPKDMHLTEGYAVKLPEITFTQGLNLYLGGLTFELIPLPGHAPGVIGVYIPQERLMWASDCIFCRTKTYLHEAVPEHWLNSLKKLEKLDAEIMIPGHGDSTCDKEYLKEQADIIERWIDSVKTVIKHGLTKEEALLKVSCPDPYPLPQPGHMTEDQLNKVIIAHLYGMLASRS